MPTKRGMEDGMGSVVYGAAKLFDSLCEFFFEGRRLEVVCCDLFDLSTKVVRRYTLLFGVFTTTVADLRFNMLPDTDWVKFFR